MNEGQRNTGPPIRIQFCGVAMVMVQLEKDMSGLKKLKKKRKKGEGRFILQLPRLNTSQFLLHILYLGKRVTAMLLQIGTFYPLK